MDSERRRTPLEDSIRKLIRLTIVLYVVVGVMLVAGAVVAYQSYDSAATSEDALCSLRADLVKRIESSQKFLDEHPEGLPKLGFSAAQIAQNIRNQGRTVDALDESGLDCT